MGTVPRTEIIGPATLMLGDALELVEEVGPCAHWITDPPYEAIMHESKARLKGLVRADGSHSWQPLDFEPIDAIRPVVVEKASRLCRGWFIAFCTSEGVGRWADCINGSSMRYKRACVWVKPDSTPQMNGQGPAQGAEHFVTAWNGKGHARWNAGGKRGVYTHQVNPRDRHGLHPTEKPHRLMSEIVADFTSPGEVICDPFMGSGSTGVSAVMAGRGFVGIEQNERYFDAACERVAKACGQLDDARASDLGMLL